jgi:hypothetical protein
MPLTFETVREIALALPGVEEGTSYGTPAFRVRGKFLARLREDGETLVVKCDYPERDLRMEINDLLELAWRSLAPKRLLKVME